MRYRLAAVMVGAVMAAVTLAGCAGSSSSGALTLVDIKSPVQLLRNEVANRIPSDVIDGAIQSVDNAVACKAGVPDPDQKYLTWQSNVTVNIKQADSAQLSDIRSTLLDSFRQQGWNQGIADSPAFLRIKKPSSLAVIDVGLVKANTKLQIDGQLTIHVVGPCVLTDGLNSPQVKQLTDGS